MTRFADPDVYACPACEAYFTRTGFKSISFFGAARDWSDGVPTMWWSRRLRPLVRCRSCAALFWIHDLNPVGVRGRRPEPLGRFERWWAERRGDPHGRLQEEQRWQQAPKGWETAQEVDTASFEDLAYVLGNSAGVSPERLLWLRTHIWWELNDRHRIRDDGTHIPNVPHWPEPDERANMEAMLELLDASEMTPGDQVQKGEVLRLLGRFGEAVAVLKAVPADGHNECRAVMIERLARQGDLQVRLLTRDVL